MLAINGIYENGKINPLQDVPVDKKYIVRITFIEPFDDCSSEHNDNFLMAAESSMEFWNNEIDDEIWNNL